MGCVTSIAIALWLIAFALGVLLLYKVQKENLQWPFKVAGWLITVVALGGMLCCSLRCMVRTCYGGNCERPPMMMYHHGMMWKGCDCDEKRRCNDDDDYCSDECEGEKSACRKGSCKHEKEEDIELLIKDSTTSVKHK